MINSITKCAAMTVNHQLWYRTVLDLLLYLVVANVRVEDLKLVTHSKLVSIFDESMTLFKFFFLRYLEYRIPGTAAPDGSCTFTYRSTSKKKGEFNSPRYPSNYPSDTNCTYLFLATPNEQVTLVFDNFKVRADSANSSIGSYG